MRSNYNEAEMVVGGSVGVDAVLGGVGAVLVVIY